MGLPPASAAPRLRPDRPRRFCRTRSISAFTNKSPLRALACGSLVVETCTGY